MATEEINHEVEQSEGQSNAPALREPTELDMSKRLDNTSPEVARRDALGQTVGVMDFLWTMAGRVANTPLARKDRGKQDAVFAKMMRGYEVGLQPMQSLDAIELIQDVPTLKPEVMLAIIRQHGHDYRWEQRTATKAVISAHRREWPADRWSTFEYTTEDARLSGLLGKDNWKKQPGVMCCWRVVAAMGRAEFADVLHGLSYVPDEILDIIETTATPISPTPQPTTPAIAPAPQLPTESEPQWAGPMPLARVSEAMAKLSPEGEDELRAWWKETLPRGSSPTKLTVENAEKVLAKCKELPQREQLEEAPAEQVQRASVALKPEIVPPPTPPQATPEPDAHELLKAIWREKEIDQHRRLGVARHILGTRETPLKRLQDMTQEEARRVAQTLDAMSDEKVREMLLGIA